MHARRLRRLRMGSLSIWDWCNRKNNICIEVDIRWSA